MKKEYFSLLPYYSFQCDENLIKDLIAEVNKCPTKVGNRVNETLTNHGDIFYNENLFNWISKCLEQLKPDFNLPTEINLVMVDCWANESKKLNAHHRHSHPNSFLSGILYLTTHETGNTVFYKKNHWFENFEFVDFHRQEVVQKVKPIAGNLIVFPSYLEHSVLGMTTNDQRLTISFNAFLSGKFGRLTTNLEMSVKSLKQKYIEIQSSK